MDHRYGERRSEERECVCRPCKIFDPGTGKYWEGSTANMSPGGALLAIPRPLDIHPGDRIHIGIAAKRRQPVLRAGEMIEAEVLRALLTVDDQTLLGVRFETEEVALALAA